MNVSAASTSEVEKVPISYPKLALIGILRSESAISVGASLRSLTVNVKVSSKFNPPASVLLILIDSEVVVSKLYAPAASSSFPDMVNRSLLFVPSIKL